MRLALIPLLLLTMLSGCGWHGGHARDNGGVHIRQTKPAPAQTAVPTAGQTADRLERLAESIPQVNKATCVIFGNTAVIGIDVQGKLDRSRIGTIKYTVAEALRKDPYGKHALVTADIDLNHRLAALRAEIRKGRPVAGLAKEMGEIIGRIMPQFPRSVPGPTQNPDRAGQLRNRSL